MPLYLIADALDAYEAAQRARLDLQASYEIALDAGDRLGLRRIEKLAADYDLRNPSEPPVLGDVA